MSNEEQLMEENKQLRKLVQDFYAMQYGNLMQLAQDIRRGGTPLEQFVEAWQQERDALQQRAQALLHGVQEKEQAYE